MSLFFTFTKSIFYFSFLFRKRNHFFFSFSLTFSSHRVCFLFFCQLWVAVLRDCFRFANIIRLFGKNWSKRKGPTLQISKNFSPSISVDLLADLKWLKHTYLQISLDVLCHKELSSCVPHIPLCLKDFPQSTFGTLIYFWITEGIEWGMGVLIRETVKVI